MKFRNHDLINRKPNLITNRLKNPKKHTSFCKICKHPQKLRIEAHLRFLTMTEKLMEQYGVTFLSIVSHIDFMKMWPDIEKMQRIQQYKAVIQLNSGTARNSDRLTFLDQLNKQVGAYKEPEVSADVELLKVLLKGMNPQIAQQMIPQQILPDQLKMIEQEDVLVKKGNDSE